MIDIAILGSSIPALECAHTTLDETPSARVTVYTGMLRWDFLRYQSRKSW